MGSVITFSVWSSTIVVSWSVRVEDDRSKGLVAESTSVVGPVGIGYGVVAWSSGRGEDGWRKGVVAESTSVVGEARTTRLVSSPSRFAEGAATGNGEGTWDGAAGGAGTGDGVGG